MIWSDKLLRLLCGVDQMGSAGKWWILSHFVWACSLLFGKGFVGFRKVTSIIDLYILFLNLIVCNSWHIISTRRLFRLVITQQSYKQFQLQQTLRRVHKSGSLLFNYISFASIPFSSTHYSQHFYFFLVRPVNHYLLRHADRSLHNRFPTVESATPRLFSVHLNG